MYTSCTSFCVVKKLAQAEEVEGRVGVDPCEHILEEMVWKEVEGIWTVVEEFW